MPRKLHTEGHQAYHHLVIESIAHPGRNVYVMPHSGHAEGQKSVIMDAPGACPAAFPAEICDAANPIQIRSADVCRRKR